ncbi:MAG: carbohydrate ABC transporter permease [Chloroflexi bacterium]|nr:carbohydrate ABC transporter permease [Chloroflexota bacterium]
MAATAANHQKSARLVQTIGTATHYIVLLAVAAMMALPLVWMVSTSLKPRREVFKYPPQFIPEAPQWQNYSDAWAEQPFGRFMINSLKVSILSVLGQILFCSLGGYGFARFNFPFKNQLFALLLASMMIPNVVNIVPLFIGYREVGWLDNHITLIATPALASTFGTFLYRQFMMTIPQELEDAARIDGASAWGIYWRIMLPLTKPVAAVLATFTFIGTWNQFFQPLVFLQSTEQFTISIGLATFRQEEGTIWNLLMAASVITLMPTLIVFMFTQQYFVRGIVTTGIK